MSERPSALPWPPLLLAGLAIGGVALGRLWPLAWPGHDDHLTVVAGGALACVGLGLIAWAILTLRRHDTTVLPNAGARALVTEGPYATRRNPIYLGDVLLLLAAAMILRNIWLAGAAVLFMLLVTWLAILPEERHLAQRFGDAYADYLARTRRWL